MTGPALKALENRRTLPLSTIERYVKALGGDTCLLVMVDGLPPFMFGDIR